MLICEFSGDVLEIGVQWSVAKKDIPSFERYISQLKCYYFDYRYSINFAWMQISPLLNIWSIYSLLIN